MNKEDWGMQFVMNRIINHNPGFCKMCNKKLNFFNKRVVYVSFGFVDEYCRNCYRLRKETIKKTKKHGN